MKNRNNRLLEFDSIMRVGLDGQKYWMLSDVAPLLGYSFSNIKAILHKAMLSCRLNENDMNEHFHQITRIIDTATAPIEVKDWLLSRYACVLLLNNCSKRKDGVTLGKVYFADKPDLKDLDLAVAQYDETFKRLIIRNEIKQWNKRLANAANKAGVALREQHAVFQNAGYLGLYRMTAEDLRRKRVLESGAVIPEYMCSAELAVNLFRITQTVEILWRKRVSETADAVDVHYKVGKEIRACLKRISAAMPEDYPAAVQVSQLEREQLAIIRSNDRLQPTDYDVEDESSYWDNQIS